MMRTNVPPDLRAVLDAVHLYQEVEVALILLERFEVIRDFCPRKFLEYFAAIRFQSGIKAKPEGRRSRHCEDVRQEVPGRIHNVNSPVVIRNADMNVYPENE